MKFRHELPYDASPGEVFADPSGGSLRIEAPGRPASVGGTIALVADGAGTTEVVELELSVTVPLIGGKLEGLLAEQLRNAMDVENEIGIAWLRGGH